MTILYTSQRYEPLGSLCGPPIKKEQSIGAAVISLFRYELGYGGKITDIQPDYIEVLTPMMGRYDITGFRGSPEEMKPLMVGVSFWMQAKEQQGINHTNKLADFAIKNKFNTPLKLSMLATVGFGGWVAPALYAAAGLTLEQAQMLDAHVKAEIERDKQQGYLAPSTGDIIDPIIELIFEGSPFEECLQLS